MKYFPNKITMLITIILMDLLAGMEFDLFVPSFAELQKHFYLSAFWVETLLSVNFIGYCLSLFFTGKLADHYSRKLIILLGLITFIIGSIFCLWASNFEILLIGRFFQGFGIAAPAILSFVILADIYPIKQQQFLMAILNGSMNLAVALAPVIGSYITLYFHWRGNFAVLLFLGLLTLIMTLLFIPFNKPLKINSKQYGYTEILKSKSLLLLIACILFVFVPYWIFVGISPLFYIKNLGVNLRHFGYYQGILALVFSVGSVIYGLIIKNSNYQQIKMLSLANKILILSLVIIILPIIFHSKNPLFITLAFIPFIIGQIIPSTILYPLALNYIPQAKGQISAIIQGARLIVAALSLQIVGYFYQGTFRNIGICITFFIFFAIITLFFITQKEKPYSDLAE